MWSTQAWEASHPLSTVSQSQPRVMELLGKTIRACSLGTTTSPPHRHWDIRRLHKTKLRGKKRNQTLRASQVTSKLIAIKLLSEALRRTFRNLVSSIGIVSSPSIWIKSYQRTESTYLHFQTYNGLKTKLSLWDKTAANRVVMTMNQGHLLIKMPSMDWLGGFP
jgi:hypothetical protein